jgi:hypothetical protein
MTVLRRATIALRGRAGAGLAAQLASMPTGRLPCHHGVRAPCPDETVIEPEGDFRGRRDRGRGGDRDGTGR